MDSMEAGTGKPRRAPPSGADTKTVGPSLANVSDTSMLVFSLRVLLFQAWRALYLREESWLMQQNITTSV